MNARAGLCASGIRLVNARSSSPGTGSALVRLPGREAAAEVAGDHADTGT